MKGLLLKPDQYQIDGMFYALKHHYSINGDAMGLGKTLQALMLATAFKRNTLIVCPAHLRVNWEAEIYKSLSNPGRVRQYTRLKDIKHPLESGGFSIISYDALAAAEPLFSWSSDGLVIYDEIHYLKEMTSARSQLSHKLLFEYAPPRFLGLSGTPIKNDPYEWFSPLTLCSYNMRRTSGVDLQRLFQTHEEFGKAICFQRWDGYKMNYEGLAKPNRLWSLLENKYIRREKSQVKRDYQTFEKTVVISFKEDKALLEAYEKHLLAHNASAKPEAKRNSALMKTDYTIKYCKDLLAAGEGPLVIFSDHVEPVEKIAQALGGGFIHSGVSQIKRRALTNDFQEGKLPVLALTIGAGSTGYTLTRSRNAIFNDYSWVPGDNDQAGDRVDRKTQTRDVTKHYIFGSPQDCAIFNRLQVKRENIRRSR